MKQYDSRIDLDLSLHALVEAVNRLTSLNPLLCVQECIVVQQCCTRLHPLANSSTSQEAAIFNRQQEVTHVL